MTSLAAVSAAAQAALFPAAPAVAPGQLRTAAAAAAAAPAPWAGAAGRPSKQQRLRVARRAEEEADEEDTTNVDLFRQSLIQGWGGGGVGSVGPDVSGDWAELLSAADVRAGDLLLADPMWFVGDDPDLPRSGPERVGLQDRLPSFCGPRDILRLLPVILLTRVDKGNGMAEGVALTLRTGKLMGDFINHFHSRPLLFGGPSESGLTMVHPYKQVPGAQELSDSGLFMGGDFAGAQEWVDDGEGSSLRFRFFMNRCLWQPGDLQKEMAATGDESAPGNAPFLPVRVSTNLALSEVDSIEDKPLWVRIAELVGGAAREAGRRFELLD